MELLYTQTQPSIENPPAVPLAPQLTERVRRILLAQPFNPLRGKVSVAPYKRKEAQGEPA